MGLRASLGTRRRRIAAGTALALFFVVSARLGVLGLGRLPLIGKMTFESMRRPVFALSTNNGLCGGVIAVERDGQSWKESGCELHSTGWSRGGRLTGARLARFEAALARVLLLRDTSEEPLSCRPAPGEPASALVDQQTIATYQRSVGAARRWYICADDKRRPAEFRQLLDALPNANE